ncbi:MAG: peptide methionine sulfoxide reductase msrA/msrB [Oceanotoga sp.]|uniref:bifunctional methionine sulfoxide reductase B/A protein n=1 Tax=Oceanotoga sp. TaxID=2108366 RepID=UPI00264AC2C8|nr:bifunctional methionine sulfoxide reductase B/A protein [Oceanotoga sp.]MDN5343007.1 peptide methionine sulfoxide reductase msrA/msrB [Oceanotoga sp.]
MCDKYKKLTPEEFKVIINKHTERPYTGKYDDFFEEGTYICKQCGIPLYRSNSKFKSNCGWPSFDDEIPGSIRKNTDADGIRTEILCSHCGGHLGHVFEGENFTEKNIRHCVNSISMDFIPQTSSLEKMTAYFAAGCFWGVEYMFSKLSGVIDAISGYSGGFLKNPSYEQVCSNKTGHVETVQIVYNPNIISYEKLLKYFFEIHDFSQKDGQGPDIGDQYKSFIFFVNEEQKKTAEKIVEELKDRNLEVATQIEKVKNFYSAEDYHQKYYEKTGKAPYCHSRRTIFKEDYLNFKI